MLLRLLVGFGLASLAVFLVLSSCSSSKKRDQNYGTDAGLDFQIPDASTIASQQVTGDASATEVGPDVLPASGLAPADTSAQESGPASDASGADGGTDSADAFSADAFSADS